MCAYYYVAASTLAPSSLQSPLPNTTIPHADRPESEKDIFYLEVQGTYGRNKNKGPVYLMGDWNDTVCLVPIICIIIPWTIRCITGLRQKISQSNHEKTRVPKSPLI